MTGGNLENFSSASEWAGPLDARWFDDDRESIGSVNCTAGIYSITGAGRREEAWLDALGARVRMLLCTSAEPCSPLARQVRGGGN